MRRYTKQSHEDRALDAQDSEVLAYSMLEKVKRDNANCVRGRMTRKAVVTQGCEDRRTLVPTLLMFEACEIVNRELSKLCELDSECIDDELEIVLVCALYNEVYLELESGYTFKWRQARKLGYKKQLASFIQECQGMFDGSTADVLCAWPHGWFDDSIDAFDLENELDYLHVIETARDYRFDDEHEARAKLWRHKAM